MYSRKETSFNTNHGYQLSNNLPDGWNFPKTLQMASKLTVYAGGGGVGTEMAFTDGVIPPRNTSPPFGAGRA